jgi:branched-chain amino acid transport system substrate-binding protein
MKYNGVLGETTFDSNGQTKVAVAIAQYVVKGGKWERM